MLWEPHKGRPSSSSQPWLQSEVPWQRDGVRRSSASGATPCRRGLPATMLAAADRSGECPLRTHMLHNDVSCSVGAITGADIRCVRRAAANCYCQLLASQSDNNVKLIVLDRLQV